MSNKKGFVISFIGKIIIFVVIFIIIISIFTGMIGKLKQTTIEIFVKEMEEFKYSGGSYFNPGVMGTDFEVFWKEGFLNFIQAGTYYTDIDAIGAFYIDQRINMRGTHLGFVSEEEGIVMLLTGKKGALGVINDKVFVNTEEKEWKLCVIKPESTSALAESFNNAFSDKTKAFKVQESWIQEVHSVSIDFTGKTKGEKIQGDYFTTEELMKDNKPPEVFDYHAVRVGKVKKTDLWSKIKFLEESPYERYLFLFVVSKDHFCILPSTRDNANSKAFNINTFETKLRTKANDPFYLDGLSSLSRVPGGDQSLITDREKHTDSVFEGYKSCFYYGCKDIKGSDCEKIFGSKANERCSNLCSAYSKDIKFNSPEADYQGVEGVTNFQCTPCHDINKCKKYEGTYDCLEDSCDLGCRYDSVNENCVET